MLKMKYIRLKKGMTQETLGAASGIFASAISRYESGGMPKKDHLVRVARALDVHPSRMYRLLEEMEPAVNDLDETSLPPEAK